MDRAALVSDDSVHGLPPSYHPAQDYPEESSVTEHSGGCRNRRRSRNARGGGAAVLEKGSGKGLSTSSGNDMLDTAHTMIVQSKDVKGDFKPEIESNSALCCKLADQNVQASEAPKQDYIHVRARRGQATDSHSLAERARREKISDRMKILQDLVPGCNKVIGKASILDEIINYIQSLQCQVEFLSMKLETIDSRMNSANGGFPTKDFGMPTFGNAAAGQVFGPPRDYLQESASEWLHMQVGGGLDRAS